MGKRSFFRLVLVRLIQTGVGLALLGPGAADSTGAPAAAAGAVSLIYAGWYGNTIPTPAFIKAHQAFLESQPFNGLVAYLRNDSTGANATSGVMSGGSLSAATLADILGPMKGMNSPSLVDNFGLVQGSTPPDFFDDWTNPIQNFAALAAALKDAGFRGICFDNEQYQSPWGNYPTGARYPSKTLQEYQDQARLRGSQVMQAMVAQFPDIAVITLHGPYISELSAPASLGFPQWQTGNELLGPFFAGFVDGSGTTGVPVDGGELYTLRSLTDFQNSYSWRKYTLPSASVNCPFIPTTLRSVWPGRVSISFGVYDQPFGGAPMDATILKSTLTNALGVADRYVWFYTEGPSFLLPPSSGGASASWVDAVRQAIATVPTPPSAPDSLVAQTVSETQIQIGWNSTASGVTGFEIERMTGTAGTFESLATTGAGVLSYTDSALAAGTTYSYRVRAVSGTLKSDFSNEASATTSLPPSSASSGGGQTAACGLVGLDAVALLGLAAWAGRRFRIPSR